MKMEVLFRGNVSIECIEAFSWHPSSGPMAVIAQKV